MPSIMKGDAPMLNKKSIRILKYIYKHPYVSCLDLLFSLSGLWLLVKQDKMIKQFPLGSCFFKIQNMGSIISVVGKSTVEIMEPFLV